MQSKHSQRFNHDPIATGYDENVENEDNPIRTGYGDLMSWIKEKTTDSKVMIDLGCGTGNTTLSLSNFDKVYCVDISQNMLDIAKEKLQDRGDVSFIKNDLLGFFDDFREDVVVDTIVSTYAIHHLTQDEKHSLFNEFYSFLPQGGVIILGDLMFENNQTEELMREKYPNLVEDFDDEFFWNLEDEVRKLEETGFEVTTNRFSDLSWGIYGVKK